MAVKPVEVALVSYTDPRGMLNTTLAIIGDNKVQLLDGQALGITKARTPVGLAAEWLKKGIFEKIGKKVE